MKHVSASKRPDAVVALDKLTVKAQAQLLEAGITHPERELRIVMGDDQFKALLEVMEPGLVAARGLTERSWRGLPVALVSGNHPVEIVRVMAR